VDVIIGSISSEFLRRAIISAAGNKAQTAYDTQLKNHPNSTLIITPSGSLSCKQIFFVKWQPDPDEEVLRQSIIYIISIVVQKATSSKFTSIAFPALGCGQHGFSIEVVVNTFVLEMKKQLIKNNLPWNIKFIVQPGQQNIYDEFCKQVLTDDDGNLKNFFFIYQIQLLDIYALT
jgi:O-acetyl-ADP-ribose deacetylase (regulator of RNase III)